MQNFSITVLSTASVSVPRARIECQVTDPATGAVLTDFMGANALIWPAVWGTLTAAQRRDLGELIAERLVLMKAGLG